MISVAVLGSTGSVGRQTLNVIRRFKDKFRVSALVCGSDADTLLKQAEEFRPVFVGIADESKACCFNKLSYKCAAAAGDSVQQIAASLPETDVVVAAVVGLNGLTGVVAAINAGKRVALANKETLVACGEYVTKLAAEKNVEILPVDSEHCAVFQCLKSGRDEELKRIILTASGGPFFGVTDINVLKRVTPEQAVRHPNWSMGKKISVDSATMMNKGLEIIEARMLFGTENIDYIIQPDSKKHSMVEIIYGSERLAYKSGKFDFSKNIRFAQPDETMFPMPRYAINAMKIGGTAPALMNAANEAAVALFLSGKIAFTDIMIIVEHLLNSEKVASYRDYTEIIDLHARIYGGVLKNYGRILGY